jgi:hypothetical protein
VLRLYKVLYGRASSFYTDEQSVTAALLITYLRVLKSINATATSISSSANGAVDMNTLNSGQSSGVVTSGSAPVGGRRLQHQYSAGVPATSHGGNDNKANGVQQQARRQLMQVAAAGDDGVVTADDDTMYSSLVITPDMLAGLSLSQISSLNKVSDFSKLPKLGKATCVMCVPWQQGSLCK